MPEQTIASDSAWDVNPSASTFAVGNGTNFLSDEKWGVWARGYGVWGDREEDTHTPGYQYTTYGTSFGFDYRVTEKWLLGITGGLSDGKVNYFSSSDESDITSRHIGLYGSYNTQKWYLDSILTYTALGYDTERYVALTSEKLTGSFDGYAIGGYFEAGLNLFGNKTLKQPHLAFQFSNLELDSYSETGGASSLSYDSQEFQSYKGILGMKWTRELYHRDDGRNALLQFRSRWVHEFGDTESSVNAHFSSAPSASFTISDDSISRNSAVLGAGFTAMLAKNMWMSLDYDTNLNADDNAHIVSFGLIFRR